jgi:tetratricopeptide (TPR) repeat protein
MLRRGPDESDDAAVESVHKRFLALAETVVGPEHPQVATAANTLAKFYRTHGSYDTAEPLYQRALAIREAVLGSAHPDTAIVLNNLAALYEAQGNYVAAEPLYRRALAITESALGPEHPQVAGFLANLAGLEIALKHPVAALALLRRALLIDEHTLDNVFPFASKRMKFAFLRTVDYRFDMPLNLVVQKLPAEPDAVRAAMDAVLRWKGVVLDALARERRALSTSGGKNGAAPTNRGIASLLPHVGWAGRSPHRRI